MRPDDMYTHNVAKKNPVSMVASVMWRAAISESLGKEILPARSVIWRQCLALFDICTNHPIEEWSKGSPYGSYSDLLINDKYSHQLWSNIGSADLEKSSPTKSPNVLSDAYMSSVRSSWNSILWTWQVYSFEEWTYC